MLIGIEAAMEYENAFDRWEQSCPFEDDPSFFRIDDQTQGNADRSLHCFFTGHRTIPGAKKADVLVRMRSAICYLYAQGVTVFHTGGAYGFDMLAAAQVYDLRRSHPDMRLILNLPFYNQPEHWTQDDKRFHAFFLQKADEVQYAYEGEVTDRENARKYLLMRNRIMVQAAHFGIAYYTGAKGGTSYTVAFAEKNSCEIINLYQP